MSVTIKEIVEIEKTIYKLDSQKRMRYLTIKTDKGSLIQESGLIDTESPLENIKICKGKNIGRSNETTPTMQAIKEAEAKIDIKLDQGYFETKQDALDNKVVLPMLAKDYFKERKKVDWTGDVFVQPKLDGMRCLAFIKDGKVKLMSRKGKRITTLEHLVLPLSTLPNMILDGELYAHGRTFQENMKMIKKYRPGETEEIMFHVYDKVDESKCFDDRFEEVYKSINFLPGIQVVGTAKVEGEDFISGVQERFLELGYEGTMIRHGKDGYKINGRSSQLLKYKDFQDITAEIIDIEPAEQRPEWGVPVLKYSNAKLTGKSESIFKAGVRMSHEDRIDMLANKDKYIGKTAEIRFFEWTDDGNPRFPIMHGIRLDK